MKFISLVLAALVMLCGCAAQTQPPTTPPATDPAPPTEATGIYDDTSVIEALTGGAVKAYPLGLHNAAGLASMGNDLLLFSGNRTTVLTRYSGDDLRVAATVTLEGTIRPDDAAVQIFSSGITYYDEKRKELVFLDADFTETDRKTLPETIFGKPALSNDLSKLYYSTGHTLRCMDLQTGLDRLLSELYTVTLMPEALHCDDAVILCTGSSENSTFCQLYISTITGRILYETTDDLTLQTRGDDYFACHMDGIYPELLIGSSEHGPTLLTPHTYGSSAFGLLEMGGAVLVTQDGSVQLDYYDLQSGKRTSSVTLDDIAAPRSFCANNDGQSLWFLSYDARYGGDVLYRWQLEKSSTPDSRSCLSARYTPENPDFNGLAACREIADRLSRKYGVQIYLWTDGAVYQPWDYTLVPEHQVKVIQQNLKELESFLSLFPSGFLQMCARKTSSAQIQICLVRYILGKEDAPNTVPEAAGLQYWDENQNTYLCLSTQQTQLFSAACHEISHIIDSRVLTFCKAYDDWNSLNPKGFQYANSYDGDLLPPDSPWLEGADRAFIDVYSTTYPKEDRARILEYAIAAGNEAYFASETMQNKLRTLCRGIREAFDLKNSTEPLVWEQYLKTA